MTFQSAVRKGAPLAYTGRRRPVTPDLQDARVGQSRLGQSRLARAHRAYTRVTRTGQFMPPLTETRRPDWYAADAHAS